MFTARVTRLVLLSASLLSVSLVTGCFGSNARTPFDTLKSSNVTALRLQNFEPPPAAAPVTAAPGAAAPGLPQIPGVQIPPEVQQWLQVGAAGLGALIPQGVLPPGVVAPGVTPTAPPLAPAQEQVPRFNNFRIIGQPTQVLDPKVLEELGEVLGDPDSYQDGPGGCGNQLYPEMGISFPGAAGQPTNDVLISFSCKKVWFSFAWASKGRYAMTDDTVKRLTSLVQKIWPS